MVPDTHREDLPNNVGFVPSSEPKPKNPDEEEEEEEDDGTKVSLGKLKLQTYLFQSDDYEDNVSKKISSTSAPTTTTTEAAGATTEPPVQLVKVSGIKRTIKFTTNS